MTSARLGKPKVVTVDGQKIPSLTGVHVEFKPFDRSIVLLEISASSVVVDDDGNISITTR
jgi:hypothetical protein